MFHLDALNNFNVGRTLWPTTTLFPLLNFKKLAMKLRKVYQKSHNGKFKPWIEAIILFNSKFSVLLALKQYIFGKLNHKLRCEIARSDKWKLHEIQISMAINVLLWWSPSHYFTNCLWPLLYYKGQDWKVVTDILMAHKASSFY